MKKILVTGCAGFIGSNLVKFLLNKRYQVIGLDNLSTGKKEFLNEVLTSKFFTFHKVDLFNLGNFFRYSSVLLYL